MTLCSIWFQPDPRCPAVDQPGKTIAAGRHTG